MPALPTLRQLAYLVELVGAPEFPRRRARLNSSRSPRCRPGIKELEKLLGVQLVERDKRSVRLTALGEDVVARARLLAAADDLRGGGAQRGRAALRPVALRRHTHDRAVSAA